MTITVNYYERDIIIRALYFEQLRTRQQGIKTEDAGLVKLADDMMQIISRIRDETEVE